MGVGTVPKQEKVSMSWLLRYLKPVKGRLILLLVLLLTSTGLQLLNPQIVKRFIDTAAEGGVIATLIQLAGLFLVVAVLTS